MKNLSTLQLVVLTIGICSIVACSKDDDSYTGDSKYITGTDITSLLREDFAAGIDVNLPAGHFYTSESIFAKDYSGTLRGAGKDVTIIEAAQGFKASFDPYVNRGAFTEMFSVYWPTGDVTFQDMTILITGEAPAEPHNNPFAGVKTTIDNVICVTGGVNGPITVTFKNLKIKGEPSSDAGACNGKNLMWPLIAVAENETYPLNLIAENCEVEHAGQIAIEYWHAHGGTGEINSNVFTDCYIGVWLGPGLAESEINVKDNEFINITNIAISNGRGYSGCFMNNTLDGGPMTDSCPQ
jgi:hypothetical protein